MLGDDFLLAFGLQIQLFNTVDKFFIKKLELEFRNAFSIEKLTIGWLAFWHMNPLNLLLIFDLLFFWVHV